MSFKFQIGRQWRGASEFNRYMSAKLLLTVAITLGILCQGCHSDSSRSTPGKYVPQVSKVTPSGWRVASSKDVLTLRRDAPLWIMGHVSRPAQLDTKEEFFKRDGQEIRYELRLRFVPLLSRQGYEKLRTARAQTTEKLREGAPGKSEYVDLQKNYEECQVPLFFTERYSVFVDRWADAGTNGAYRIEPIFVEVYPPEASSEIDALVKRLGKVFKEYEIN
jgi:hypothetical protein